MGQPAEKHMLACQLSGNATRVSVSTGASTASAQLAPGLYIVTCDQDVRIKQGASSVTVSSSQGFVLWAKSYVHLWVDDSTNNAYVAGRSVSSSGTLELMPIAGD